MTTGPFVIVGGGLAAAEAAKTLRAEGFAGDLVIVAEERHAPYERPPLSKAYLRGETAAATMAAQPPDFYATGRIDVLSGTTAEAIRPAERMLVLAGGREIRFTALLLATGSSATRPDISGADRPGVHLLRTIEDADGIRAAASAASSAVVVGGGWIAAEAAASLRQLGLEVSLVVPGARPLERHLGPEVAEHYADLHRRHGVSVVSGSRVVAVVGIHAAAGVALADGRVVSGDLVVLGLGASPRVELATNAGLEVADGIVVDDRLRTSASAIFAAGDVAAAWHPRYRRRIRTEHWDNARRQARTAARNMLGADEPYARIPYLFSDQYEASMEFLGVRGPDDELVLRSTGAAGLVAFWLAGGRVMAGLHVNTPGAKKAIDRLITTGARVSAGQLSDPAVPLAELGDVTATAPLHVAAIAG